MGPINFMFASPNTAVHPIHVILLKPFLYLLIDLFILCSGALIPDKDDSALSWHHYFSLLGDLDVSDEAVHLLGVENGCW